VFVLLGDGTSEANQPPNIGVPAAQSELIASLQDQVRYLREQLDAEREARTEERRRHDTVVAQFTSKIPAIEAPQEGSEAGETGKEEPEFQKPPESPRTVAAQEGTESPRQWTRGLAPVDKIPWWKYGLGLFLVFLSMFLLVPLGDWLFDGTSLPSQISYILLFAEAWSPPGIFGFWAGFRQTSIRLWSQIIPFGLLVTVIVVLSLFLGLFVFVNQYPDISMLYILLTIPSWLLFVSASLLGNTWQRRRIGRISGTTPASPVSRTMQGAGQQPRKDLTPTQQAMLGWGGTIISALITLVGIIMFEK
jgi:hypothetical protein